MFKIDHFVLYSQNPEKLCQFYQDILDCKIITFGENRKAIMLGIQKLNVHPLPSPHSPLAKKAGSGTADYCLISDKDIHIWLQIFSEKNIDIIEGPVSRTGANGSLISVYIYDCDGNLIEIANEV